MNLPFMKRVVEKSISISDYKPLLSSVQDLKEQFKGEVKTKPITFPDKLGEKHPFDFKMMENLYKRFSFFSAVVDKYVDFVVGPGFFIETTDERAKQIIEDFMRDVNFDSILRQWTKEALIKGNGFLEIGGDGKNGIEGLKLLNANNMYVVRDNTGKIEGYNQYTGDMNKFAKNKITPFDTENIAHVPFNIIGDDAYGIGIGYSAMNNINNLLTQEKSMHVIMNRKANSPLHAKLGKVDGNTKIIPKPADVTKFGKDMENMHNKTDWATDPLVDLKVVDFGNIGDKYDKVLEYDLNMLIYSFQIPGVLLGMANVAEGLAIVQMEAFQRRIQSIQAELEKIIETNIFKRVLAANGIEADVEFEWGSPSILEVEGRMKLISDMMKSPIVTPAMKQMLENEMINLLKFDKDEWKQIKLEQEKKEEEERKRLEAQPQPIVPGQNKSFPKPVAPKKEQPKQPKPEEMMKPVVDLISENDKKNKEQIELLFDCFKKSQEITVNTIKSNDSIVNKNIESVEKEINKKMETIEKDINKIDKKVDVKNEEIKQLAEEKEEIEKENVELDKQIKESEAKQKESNNKLEEKEKELKNLEDVIKDKKTEKNIDNPQLTELKDNITQLKDEIKQLKEKIEVRKETIKKTKKIFKKKKGVLSSFKQEKVSEAKVEEVVKKVGDEWCVISHTTGKSLGCFSSKGKAQKRLSQIKGFSARNSYEYDNPCPHCTEEFGDINDVSEWLGFSYKKYLNEILVALNAYDFDQIKAINEIELNAGRLSTKQVNDLREIMDDGFRKGQSISEMTKAVDRKVGLKDLYRMEDGQIKRGASGLPILARGADKRAVAIVRSEITKVANMGAVKHYKEGGIKQVRWIASVGKRTCPICEGLDNQIYEINAHPAIPQHTMCRCTLAPVVELK